jgi:murein DD-endopeptidase MepM/ murein hydrolase activator NlpD
MVLNTCRALTLSLLLSGLATYAQQDDAGLGGPEGLTPFAEGYADVMTDATTVWTPADSLRNIPCHALYREFDTDVIFDRSGPAVADTATLRLTHAACDSYFPVCGAVTSPFGPRHRRMHYGVDIELDRGDTVVAAFEGMVRISRYHGQFGNVVVIRHSNGLETLYGHLSQRSVNTGDIVEAGQLIGLGGSTGRSTGDHLHFETRYLGQPIDPRLLFNIEEGELQAHELHVHPGLFRTSTVGAKTQTSRIHVVRRGDTLSSIARRRGTSVQALCRANRIGKSSKLRIGQRLRY